MALTAAACGDGGSTTEAEAESPVVIRVLPYGVRSDFDTLAVVNPFQPDEPPVTQLHLWPQDTAGNGMFVAAWKKL